MKGSLKMKLTRSSSTIRRLITFLFLSILPGTSVVSRSFQVAGLVNRGEVIVSQRRATGSISNPVVRYQFVSAVTGLPVTNSVTVSGTRIVTLPFILPPGSFRLRITNVGTGSVRVEGVILVF